VIGGVGDAWRRMQKRSVRDFLDGESGLDWHHANMNFGLVNLDLELGAFQTFVSHRESAVQDACPTPYSFSGLPSNTSVDDAFGTRVKQP
jgi:hypothetical protein